MLRVGDFRGDVLQVLIGANSETELRKSLRRVASFANKEVEYTIADRDRVRDFVNELFTPVELRNCPVDFKVKCPKNWLRLRPTDVSTVRYCDECSRSVYYCKGDQEARDHTKDGHCIAILQLGFVDVGMAKFPDSSDKQS